MKFKSCTECGAGFIESDWRNHTCSECGYFLIENSSHSEAPYMTECRKHTFKTRAQRKIPACPDYVPKEIES